MADLRDEDRNTPLATHLRVYPDWLIRSAEAALDMLESDFGHSGRDVRLEIIRCDLDAAYRRGLQPAGEKCRHPVLLDNPEQPGVDIYVCARCKAVVRLNSYTVERPTDEHGSDRG